jgi:hypothetical protein
MMALNYKPRLRCHVYWLNSDQIESSGSYLFDYKPEKKETIIDVLEHQAITGMTDMYFLRSLYGGSEIDPSKEYIRDFNHRVSRLMSIFLNKGYDINLDQFKTLFMHMYNLKVDYEEFYLTDIQDFHKSLHHLMLETYRILKTLANSKESFISLEYVVPRQLYVYTLPV